MSGRAAPLKARDDWMPLPVQRGVLQRRAAVLANRHVVPILADQTIRGGSLSDDAMPSASLGDFSHVPAHAGNAFVKFSDDSATSAPGAVEKTTEADAGSPGTEAAGETAAGGQEPAAVPQQVQGTPVNGKVTSLDVITGSTGAVTGFAAITGGGSLDTPGPFNDTTTGACRNIHQMKFAVTGIPSSELRLLRTIDRTSTLAGVQQAYKGTDGPNPATVLRPSTSVVAVADSPGYKGASKSADFPISYNADFKLYAFDIVSKTILAELEYTVTIAKTSLGDAKPTNQISVTKKVLK